VSLFAVRKGERRDAWAAFLTLFTLISSHSMLETARDALFLAKIPATRLPWMFLTIAALSVVVVKVQGLVTNGLRPERALSAVVFAASAITLGFFLLFSRLGAGAIYALYIWSGLLATLVLVHFWALAGDLFTITQAKRLYGFIGAGSVLGAIAGSGLASLFSRFVPPEKLLLGAAIGFGATGFVPFLFGARPQSEREQGTTPRLFDTLAYVRKDPYASRVATSLFVATVCLTLADYIFKSAVAGLVPRAELGAFLGTVYFVANVLSLVCQLAVVGWLLRRISLGTALAVLPALFVVGGLGVAAAPGLFTVLGLKATDGALRYSLHRTASELLLLPFGEEARRRVKAFVELVSQRGAQVAASCVILGLTALSARPRGVALVLAALAVGWLASAMALRKPYIDLFRARLRAGRSNHVEEFPELDVASLETLLAALESHNDREVMAALDVLEREKKTNLIPALILYHPSEQVVLRALDTLTNSGRTNFVPIIDRVIGDASPAVRAAMVAARSVLAPDPTALLRRLEIEESPEVRATIVVNLIASGEFSAEVSKKKVHAIVSGESVKTRVALAEAIGRRAAAGFDDVLGALAGAAEPAVRRAAISAIGRVDSPVLLPLAVEALTDDVTRAGAEHVLAQRGSVAFDVLVQTFADPKTDEELRWRIPPAMAQCSPEPAIAVLIERLPRETAGKVRFQIIRTLERLVRRHPAVPLDRSALGTAVDGTLSRACRYLDASQLLGRGAAQDPSRRTPGHDLLRALLRDKEANAKGRLFRLLGLLFPDDDLGQIYRGLAGSKELRATSMELLDSILHEPLRSAVTGFVDDGDDALRLARTVRYHRAFALDYDAMLQHLAGDESESVREVTQFHGAELGLTERLSGQGRAA
jgi:ATP/ADP translocase/HEAT repeat protein